MLPRSNSKTFGAVVGLALFVALLLVASDRLGAAAQPIPQLSGEASQAQSSVEVEGVAVTAAASEPSPSPTTVPPTTTTTVAPDPARRAVVAFSGDTLAHRGVVRQAATYGALTGASYDFSPMFAQVEPILRAADIAICHLETPLAADNLGLSGYPTFNVPREMATGLAEAGYDGCTTASNHSLDQGRAGVFETLDVLEAAGLQTAGTARDQNERESPVLYDAGGITVANISYSYGFNGFRRPSDMWWIANPIEIEQIEIDAERARAAGAEVVIASLHWGIEYSHEPTADQRVLATEIGALDLVDVVIGHHAHVVQPVDKVGDSVVVYGLGNFLSNQSANCCAAGAQDGVIVQVVLEEQLDNSSTVDEAANFDISIEFVPTWVDRNDFTIVDVNAALDQQPSSALRQALEASRERTVSVLGQLTPDLELTELGG